MCECGNRDRQGGVDRLTRPGNFFFVFCLYFCFLSGLSVPGICYATAPNLFGDQKKPGWRRFSLGVTLTVSVVKTAQKKEGRGETTWGDNKKKVLCCEPTMTLWGDP